MQIACWGDSILQVRNETNERCCESTSAEKWAPRRDISADGCINHCSWNWRVTIGLVYRSQTTLSTSFPTSVEPEAELLCLRLFCLTISFAIFECHLSQFPFYLNSVIEPIAMTFIFQKWNPARKKISYDVLEDDEFFDEKSTKTWVPQRAMFDLLLSQIWLMTTIVFGVTSIALAINNHQLRMDSYEYGFSTDLCKLFFYSKDIPEDEIASGL